MIDQDKTYEMKGSEQEWVSQPSSGLDKRQATLQLCIRAEGQQNVKPGIQGRSQVSKPDEASLERQRRDPLGGSGGMPPPENFEI